MSMVKMFFTSNVKTSKMKEKQKELLRISPMDITTRVRKIEGSRPIEHESLQVNRRDFHRNFNVSLPTVVHHAPLLRLTNAVDLQLDLTEIKNQIED